MRRHTDYENMVAAYDGISPAGRRELDAHLAQCPACAADLAAYRQMDTEIRSARALKASAGLRVRFNEALSAATAAPTPELKRRPVIQEPVIRRTKRPRQPWTWSRLLMPAGFILLFVAAIAMSLPRDGGDDNATPQQPVVAPPQQAQVVKLNFRCDVASYSGYDGWLKALADFETENPDIDVNFTPAVVTGSDTASYQSGLADMAAQTDVFCAIPDVDDAQAGIVMDLAPYIANDPAFQPEDIFPGLLKRGETGMILSVPTYFKPLFINYNPEAFDKAGVPYPQPGWTWDEFLATAAALTQRNGDEIEQWGYYEVGAFLFSSHLWSVWSDDLQTPPDYATMTELLRWYQKLYVETGAANVPPTLDSVPGGQYENRSLEMLLRAGRVAMWEAGWSSTADEPRHLATYPAPLNGVHIGRMSDMVISGQTAHPDEAWRLLSYLSRHLPDAEVPSRRSLAETASFWEKLDESSKAAYHYILDRAARPYTKLPAESQFYLDAVIAVAKGKKTAEQALAELDAQVHLRDSPGALVPEPTMTAEIVTATPAPTTPPPGATVITFGCWRERLPVYEPAVAVFQDENPGVYVELKALEDLGVTREDASLRPQVIAQIAAQVDTLCDDSLPVKIRTGEAEAALRDLSPFIAADAAFDAADFYPGTLEMLQSDAQTWGVPRGLLLQMIYYNQYAFDQAGMSYPATGWTWDGFLSTAKTLTQTREDGSTRWGFKETWPSQFGLLRAHGLTFQSGEPAELMKPETQAALQWYVDLVKTQQVMPVPAAYTGAVGGGGLDSAANPWADTAMLSAPANGVVADSGKVAGVAPFPLGPNSRTSPLEQIVDAIVMSAGTQHPAESWRWLSVASRTAGYPERMIPARRSSFEASVAVSGVDPVVRDTYRYALEHLTLPFDVDALTMRALRGAIRTALVDGVPVDEALRKASGQ